MATPKSGFNHPENKRRSDGKAIPASEMREAKRRVANGKPGGRHPETGGGSQRLGMRRLWRWMTDNDDDQ
jgi:hypothetical protein